MSLKETFKAYAVFGRRADQDKDLTGKNFAKLVKEKKMMDKKLNSTEVDMIFTKANRETKSKTLDFARFEKALEMIAECKGKTKEEICDMIVAGGGPSTSGTTKVTNVESVSKMTDTSKYTGSHKERFDESGRGRGSDGRKDKVKNTGYVGAYKGDSTYDKTH